MLIVQPRIWRDEAGIIGMFHLPGMRPIFTYELPWKDNRKNVSCIPAGLYHCVLGDSSKNRHWGKAFYVQNVSGRDRVIFGHIGNDHRDSEGCTLFGLYYDRAGHIGGSAAAIDIWMQHTKNLHGFELLIIDNPVIEFNKRVIQDRYCNYISL